MTTRLPIHEPPYPLTPASAFDVSVRSDPSASMVIELRGELDLCTGPILKQHLESYQDPSESNGHASKVVYHLPELSFMDARGLRYLLSSVNGYGSETITVRKPSSSVRRLLELVGLDSMIEESVNP